MTQIINELATIEVSEEMLQQLDIDSIYQSFSENYRKLDNLKKTRSAHEDRSWIGRWWNSDELRDAQLDSAEVQAEFSKAIGQLMVISIMQSREHFEQQTQLNEQQSKLKTQADGIEEHACELKNQHQVLAKQSEKLETLVHEYFALKGLTEESTQRLIDIAKEVKFTKEGMLQEFAIRTKDVEVLCGDMTYQMTSLSAQVNHQMEQSAEQIQSAVVALQQETRNGLAASEFTLRNQQKTAQQAMSQDMAKLEQGQREAEASRLAKNAALESSFSCVSAKLEQQEATHREKLELIEGELGGQVARTADVANDLSQRKAELAICIQQQQTLQGALESFQCKVSGRIKRLGYLAVGLSVVVLGMLGGMAHILRWI